MKKRLVLYIEKEILEQIKAYVSREGMGVSGLVEEYFSYLLRSGSGKNIISLVEELPVPQINLKEDLKNHYHENSGR